MIKKRVVIVEDHSLARNELSYLLTTYHPDMVVVGEFETPELAWETIPLGNIDGVFLDISFDQLDEKGGLKLARRIRLLNPAPWIVFVTGHEEHALIAHDFRPLGYLLKPIDDIKLEVILNRVREEIPTPKARIEVKHRLLRQTIDGRIEKVFLTKFLLPDEILYIRTNDGINTVKVFLVNGEILEDVNIRLNIWLNDYHLPTFVQSRKNAIVNLKYVSGYKSDPDSTEAYLLLFRNNPTELLIGAAYFAGVKAALRQYVS